MECVAFDGGFERGIVERIVDGNHVRGGFTITKYRFYSVESSHARCFLEVGGSCRATLQRTAGDEGAM